MAFNGLGMNLGNLSRLSERADALASARRTSPARRARPAWPPRAPAPTRARDLGQGWKVSPSVAHRSRARRFDPGRHRRPRRDPADLDDAHRPLALQHPAHLLGRRGAAVGRVPRGRLLRLRLGPVRARSTRCRSASTPAAPSTATGRCPSASAAASRWRTSTDEPMTLYYQINYTLTDVPDGRGLLPRPVPPRQPAAVQERLHDPRRRARARASTSARTWPGA